MKEMVMYVAVAIYYAKLILCNIHFMHISIEASCCSLLNPLHLFDNATEGAAIC
jgi:hypothetical protein